MSNSANIDLKVHDTGVQRELSRTQGLVQTFASGLTATFTGITAAIKAVDFTKEIFSWGKFFVEAASEAEQNSVRLGAVLKAVGTDVGFTKNQLMALSAQIQETTKFEDDMAQKAMANALKFKNVRGPIFKEMIELSADLAEQDGTNLVGASDKLARALNDPLHGYMRLRMEGVIFSAEQKKMIETLVETGDMMGAQRIILDALRKSVGGVAAEMANTASGQVEKLKNRFGDMAESVGAMLLPFLKMLVPVVENVAIAFENMIPIVQTWSDAFKAGLDVIIDRWQPALTELKDQAIFVFSAVTVLIENFSETVQVTLRSMFDSLWETWGPTLLELKDHAVLVFAAVTTVIENFAESAQLAFDAMVLGVLQTFDSLSMALVRALPAALTWLEKAWRDVCLGIASFTVNMTTNVLNNLKTFIERVKALLKGGSASDFQFTALKEGLKRTFDSLPDDLESTAKVEQSLKESLESRVAKNTVDLATKISQKAGAMNSVIDSLFGGANVATDTGAASQDLAGKITDRMNSINNLITGIFKKKVDETDLTSDPNLDPESFVKNDKEKAKTGALEDIVALNKRIASAAAGETPEKKIEKAIDRSGEKLDVLIKHFMPATAAAVDSAKSLKTMLTGGGMPAVLR